MSERQSAAAERKAAKASPFAKVGATSLSPPPLLPPRERRRETREETKREEGRERGEKGGRK